MNKHTPQKLYVFNFAVRGSGQFPYDMLRYDHAWPAWEEESGYLAQDWAADAREVCLRMASSHDKGPNVDRWRSFGWAVTYIARVQGTDYAEPMFGTAPVGKGWS